MQPLGLRAKGAFYPETPTRKAALFDVVNPGYVAGRIDQPAILSNFKVHVVTTGTAAAAHLGNRLPALNQITNLHLIAFIVGVQGCVPIGMADFNNIAITRPLPRKTHHASRNRYHITTWLGGTVHPFVLSIAPG
jgi:hypothetical protein